MCVCICIYYASLCVCDGNAVADVFFNRPTRDYFEYAIICFFFKFYFIVFIHTQSTHIILLGENQITVPSIRHNLGIICSVSIGIPIIKRRINNDKTTKTQKINPHSEMYIPINVSLIYISDGQLAARQPHTARCPFFLSGTVC